MFLFDHFLGTIVNFAVVLVFGLLGTLIKKGIPKRISNGIMYALAICVIYIGIDGALETAPAVPDGSFLSAGLVKAIIMIVSMALGTLIGELIDIDKWVEHLGAFLERKLTHGKGGNFARGFVSCSLLFCVGAMTVNGAILDAQGKPEVLLAKAVIDGIAVFVMSTTLGIGCAISAFFVLFYQGAVTILGLGIVSRVSESTLSYMSATGSLIIILLGTNILGATKVKTANMVPAIFLAIGVEALIKLFI